MTVLVTGGSGLIGSALLEIVSNDSSLKHQFVFSNSKECNLLDYSNTLRYFNRIKPDYVIHLAAEVGGLYKNMREKVSLFENNIIINNNVLKCAHSVGIKKLISCLSTCIFPDSVEYPIKEEYLHLGPPHSSNAEYAYAKRMLEVLSNAYNKQFGTNYMCIIPTNIYGPNDNYNLEDSHVIPGLIHKFYLAKKNGTDVIIKGSGLAYRQFIYSEDLAKLILLILEKDNNNNSNSNSSINESLILSPTEEYSIKEVVNLIAESFKFAGKIIFDQNYPDGQFKKTVSNKKLLKYFPDFTFTPLDKGIIQSVNWFNTNYLKSRIN